MATYHVDSNAAAGGDGSELTPWDTIADVNGGATDNDTIKLKRGSTWHEELVVPGVNMTFEVYGTGTNPFIGKLDTNSKTGLIFSDDIDFGPWLSVNQLSWCTVWNNTLGIGFNGRVFSADTGGNIYRYYDGAKDLVYAGGAMTFSTMFVDSRDYLFVSTSTKKLLRSIDYGANFTEVLTFANGPAYNIVEDDLGNLYCGEYQVAVAFGVKVYKSTNGGATWTDITANLALPVDTFRHVHTVHWWAAKKAILVILGDAGGNSVYYSLDYGVNWTRWNIAYQILSAASDANYLYLTADAALNRSIYRTTELEGSVTKVYECTDDTLLPWNIHVTPDGYIIAFYARAAASVAAGITVISYDQGANWFEHQSLANGSLLSTPVLPSYYNSTWDKRYYGGKEYRFGACGVHPARHSLYIDPTNGVDYVNSGDSDAPWKTIEAANLWLQNGPKHLSGVKLIESLTDAALEVNTANVKLIGNQKGVNYASAAPAFSDGMEGANPYDSTTNTNATFTYDDATQPHSGLKSTSVVTTGAGVANSFGTKSIAPDASSGDTIWVRGYLYLGADVTTANYFQTIQVRPSNDSDSIAMRMKNTKIPWLLQGTTIYNQPDLTQITLAITTWYKIKISVYVHATKGRVSLWIDDELIIRVLGLDTEATADWAKGRWGLYTDQLAATVYWDDIAIGLTDPDEPNGIEVIGNDNILTQFNQTKDINVTGTGNKVAMSIVDGAVDGITIADGATGSKIHDVDVVNSSNNGIVANEDCEITNCIVKGSTGDDITIAAGKTATGLTNVFEDAAEAGAGTYSDVGATTLWATDPLFADFAGGDYRLTPESPCRDAGTDVGLTTDIEGKPVPMGSAPDIGAYEFPVPSPMGLNLSLSGGGGRIPPRRRRR